MTMDGDRDRERAMHKAWAKLNDREFSPSAEWWRTLDPLLGGKSLSELADLVAREAGLPAARTGATRRVRKPLAVEDYVYVLMEPLDTSEPTAPDHQLLREAGIRWDP